MSLLRSPPSVAYVPTAKAKSKAAKRREENRRSFQAPPGTRPARRRFQGRPRETSLPNKYDREDSDLVGDYALKEEFRMGNDVFGGAAAGDSSASEQLDAEEEALMARLTAV